MIKYFIFAIVMMFSLSGIAQARVIDGDHEYGSKSYSKAKTSKPAKAHVEKHASKPEKASKKSK